jgi:hypothetical protein
MMQEQWFSVGFGLEVQFQLQSLFVPLYLQRPVANGAELQS